MPKPPPADPNSAQAQLERRSRVRYVASAEANVEIATAQLELALGNMLSTGIDHPIIEELRETITAGKRLLARARDISKHLPL